MSLTDAHFFPSLQLDRDTFDAEWRKFERSVSRWIKQDSPEFEGLDRAPGGLQNASKRALDHRLRYLFYAQVYSGRFTKAEQENQKRVADLRFPADWFPATREVPRVVHLHVGPTNSGKTYHALKRLEQAERGIYLGPLRLLAHEVYTRLTAKGKSCALVTGEEQRLPEGVPKMWSCTVEMAPLNEPLDVAVIDEIQMINHPQRGWAWTSAFLGIQADEIHLCGEARTVPLMKELCALVGDRVVVHEYKRLTPLKVAPRSLRGELTRLEKGDCIVAFSVLGLHALRKEVETTTGKKCAIVYGGLPPETRAQQARLFNDPNNDYDFLVASDAIGMGLNLSIKRVIFESTMRNNGNQLVPLTISDIKQIGGRAGRYRSAHQAVADDRKAQAQTGPVVGDPTIGLDDGKENAIPETSVEMPTPPPATGLVTALDHIDMRYIALAMAHEPEPIKTAGLFPPSLVVERFSSYFPPGTPFSYIMLRLHEMATMHPRFHLCDLRDQLEIADVIHPIANIAVVDRITLCATPCNMRDEGERKFLYTLASCIADGTSGALLDLPNLPLEVLDEKPAPGRKYLYTLESLHKMIVAYLWLSYRFPQIFTTRKVANHAKQLTEDAIERTLHEFSWTEVRRNKERQRQQAMQTLRRLHGDIVLEEKVKGLDNGLPEGARDILNDEQSFENSEVPVDDQGVFRSQEPNDLDLPTQYEQLALDANRTDTPTSLPREADSRGASQSGI